jgi:beta-phosphoglucomutase-like phosphatase (HAD superfamily)
MATVLLDCDGVLLEWDRAFARFCATRLGTKPCASGPKHWDLAEWIGVDRDQVFALVDEFNHSPAFGNIWPCHNALRGVAQLVGDGHRLHVITSCSSASEAREMRHANLRRCFGDVFERIVCLPLGFDKSNALIHYPKGCIWVEDNYANAVAGHSAGHHTFMIHRSHNQRDREDSEPTIRWVSEWDDIISLANEVT